MTSKLKTIIKLIIYYFINLFIKPSKEIKPKSLLLIRLDAIGDYILFRNFIEILKKSERYKDYRITLLGNVAWKDLSKFLDSDYIDDFIWLDPIKFHRNIFYRFCKLREITKNGYEIVINPVYSRTYDMDMIVKIVNAKEKIGSSGDLSNIKKWQKKISDKWYTKLIPAKKEVIFEFYRNKEFFENLLGMQICIEKPIINKFKKPNLELPKKYAVIFISASSNFKKWDISNFATVAKYLKSKWKYDIVLCGSSQDFNLCKEFEISFQDSYINLVGKTSLTDLAYIIKNSQLIVSNETFAPHLSVAVGTNLIFVISNGNHLNRFVPYPEEMTDNYFAIYHPAISRNFEYYKEISNKESFVSKLDINDITPDMVIQKINEVLRTKINEKFNV